VTHARGFGTRSTQKWPLPASLGSRSFLNSGTHRAARPTLRSRVVRGTKRMRPCHRHTVNMHERSAYLRVAMYAGVQPYDYTKGLLPDECPYTKPPYWCFQKGTEEIHAAMLANADSSPIWFSEFGYSSTQTGSHQIGGPTGQARLLAQKPWQEFVRGHM
jgi:hypothetical protein